MDRLPTNPELIAAIEAFLARHDMAPTRFGSEATGDPNLLASLRAGTSPRLDRLHRVADFMKRRDAELPGADHAGAGTAPADTPSAGKPAALSPEVTHA